MKKKYIITFFSIFLICAIIFFIITYKKSKLGNNINVSDKNNILNISSYEAIAQIEVYSNKNTNKYKLKQQYIEPNIFKQEILEPENFKGLTTTFDGTNLVIENNSLNLKTLYENYNCFQGNSLSLIRFIEQFKEKQDVKIEETDEEVIIEINLDETNKYNAYKKLYINKKSNLPTKMEILDVNQNIMVYILYTEIRINNTSKEEVLGN